MKTKNLLLGLALSTLTLQSCNVLDICLLYTSDAADE